MIETAKGFMGLLGDEQYCTGTKKLTGFAFGREVFVLDRIKMLEKGVDTSNFG